MVKQRPSCGKCRPCVHVVGIWKAGISAFEAAAYVGTLRQNVQSLSTCACICIWHFTAADGDNSKHKTALVSLSLTLCGLCCCMTCAGRGHWCGTVCAR
jgi:hypothetical protein